MPETYNKPTAFDISSSSTSDTGPTYGVYM